MGDEKNTEQKPKEIDNIETKEFSQENKEDETSKSLQQDIQSVDDQIESQKNQPQEQQQQQKQQNQQKHKRKRKGCGGSGSSGKSKIQQPIKRKRQREEGAPKLPLTGYVRYILFRRDTIRKEYPDKTNVEHTKMIADEWNRMSEELKKPYLQAAEVDKERYNKQLIEFNKQKKAGTKGAITENIQQQQSSKSSPNNSTGINNSSSSGTSSSGAAGTICNQGAVTLQNGRDIPNHTIKPLRRYGDNFSIQIFTDEFLEHNKIADLELRTLRKSNIDYEQQNSVLEKHIENMKFGVEKMQTENSELIEKNYLLETYLQKLKVKLAQALSGLSIPTEPNGATIDNIDKYMADLHSMASSNSHGPASLNKAKDIIRKLDLQIQL